MSDEIRYIDTTEEPEHIRYRSLCARSGIAPDCVDPALRRVSGDDPALADIPEYIPVGSENFDEWTAGKFDFTDTGDHNLGVVYLGTSYAKIGGIGGEVVVVERETSERLDVPEESAV